jgi:hypothetical protein
MRLERVGGLTPILKDDDDDDEDDDAVWTGEEKSCQNRSHVL